MNPSCETPYTLLGFLLQRDSSRTRTCSADSHFLFRDYAIRQINAFLWVSLIFVTALLLRKVTRLLMFWRKGSKLPGPPCPSFYGHSRLISNGRSGVNLTDFLSNSHEKYGSVVRLWLGPTQLLVSVKDPDLIQEMLVKAEDKLPLTGKAFQLAFGHSSLFISSFEKVRKRRESLAIQLNGKLLERANAISLKVVDHIMERIDSTKPEGILDCSLVSQHMAFSLLGAALFGDAFLGWSNARVYEELLMMIAKDACFWASYNIPPIWKKGFWVYKHFCTRLKCLTQDMIQECRQKYKVLVSTGQDSCNETANIEKEAGIDAPFPLNEMMPGILFSEEFSDHVNAIEEPIGNIMGVMFHGCLTTAGLIGSILTRLVMHPEIQEKIYSEITAVCRNSPRSGVLDVQKMQFLLATVYESARLLPAGPLLQRCSLKHDLKLKTSIIVPAGAILAVPVQLVQMDGSNWGSDANQFNPHRFLSKTVHSRCSAEEKSESVMTLFGGENSGSDNDTFVLNDPNANAAFLPFGSGTRACVGQNFSILGIAALLASLLQRYEIKLQPGSEKDPKPTMNDCVLQLLPSPKIIFVSRNS